MRCSGTPPGAVEQPEDEASICVGSGPPRHELVPEPSGIASIGWHSSPGAIPAPAAQSPVTAVPGPRRAGFSWEDGNPVIGQLRSWVGLGEDPGLGRTLERGPGGEPRVSWTTDTQ